MGNLFLIMSITAIVSFIILVVIMVWCCLYVGAKCDTIMHMLASEYIKEKNIYK